jgi:hypothetical protein
LKRIKKNKKLSSYQQITGELPINTPSWKIKKDKDESKTQLQI